MKKIGIVSELNLENVNYGNRLQSFALNYYLNKNYEDCKAESLLLRNYDKPFITKHFFIEILKIFIKSIKTRIIKKKESDWFKKRLILCNDFTLKNVVLNPNKYLNWNDLKKVEYDIFITGSDVVWAQRPKRVNRIRFLDFTTKVNFKKVSYAASFGRDWIPNENRKYISGVLSKFSQISTREKSSIKMLDSLNIKNVKHVCDPTLLISKEDWKKFAIKDNELQQIKEEKFIFVYLLGKSSEQRKIIKEIACKNDLKIINIIHANGKYDSIDEKFGDYRINECSPCNWLWLISNAEYIFTDSFHGAVLATIFEKKFFVLKRESKININNRMIDYMNTIGENNKIIDTYKLNEIDQFSWDYSKIKELLNNFVLYSKKYLDDVIKY